MKDEVNKISVNEPKILNPKEGSDFSFSTIENFDKHISQSIFGLDSLYDVILEVSKNFIWKGTNIYDLGCSTGKLLNRMHHRNKDKGASYIGYDIEKNLLPNKNTEDINFFNRDITDPSLKFINPNLIIFTFTLQFLSADDKEKVFFKAAESLNKGGAIIVAEKIIGKTGVEENILSVSSKQLKRRFFTDEIIVGKEDKLRFIMNPVTSDENQKLFCRPSFPINFQFFCIWQVLNFKCWLIIKES